MFDEYERGVLFRYCHNLAAEAKCIRDWSDLNAFISWARNYVEMPEVEEPPSGWNKKFPRQACEVLQKATRGIGPSGPPSCLERSLDVITGCLELGEVERAVFAAFARADTFGPASDLFNGFGINRPADSRPDQQRLLAAAINQDVAQVQLALSHNGKLLQSGLLGGRSQPWCAILPSHVRRYLRDGGADSMEFEEAILGSPQRSRHTWEDFHHLGNDRDQLLKLLEASRRAPQQGLNLLLYGEPGGGKTELCKALAQQAGISLYAVAEADEGGDEPDRAYRVDALRLAHRLLRGAQGAVLLVDEADDIITQRGNVFSPKKTDESRVFVHRLLENAPCPTIWVMNEISGVAPSVLRRMTYAVEVRMPTRRARAQLWRKMLDEHAIAADENDIRCLSTDLRGPPSIAATAVRAAKMGEGTIDEVKQTAASLMRALNGGRLPPPYPTANVEFNPQLFNPSIDLVPIERQALELNFRPVSFCLYGPSGTGKSAYLRRMAALMDMEVLYLRASDLLSMWVGGTEEMIARAFREAQEDHAFLIIDEADSLLEQRSATRKNWENSTVNELLTWMEQHPIPFGITTNHIDHLDRAALRRFTFAIRCDYLSPEQARQAFSYFFASPAPKAIERMDRLTPADFALLKRKAQILGFETDIDRLLVVLKDQMVLREGERRRIGFAA